MSGKITPAGMGTPADNAAPDSHGRGTHGGLQREQIDAALRVGEVRLDQRGVKIASEAATALVDYLGADATARQFFRDETTVDVTPAALVKAAQYMRDEQGFALLSDISPCDRTGSTQTFPARFNVDYVLTKIVEGAPRVRLRVWVNEGDEVPSLIGVYPTADWHEREAFDFFGINIVGREEMRRLIMPEDWVGHPLRKDYPIGGEPVRFTNTPREI